MSRGTLLQERTLKQPGSPLLPLSVASAGAAYAAGQIVQNTNLSCGVIVDRVVQKDAVNQIVPRRPQTGPSGTTWAGDLAGNKIWTSADASTPGVTAPTWTSPGNIGASYAQCDAVLELRSGTLLAVGRKTSNNSYSILRSTDSGATWTDVFDFQYQDASHITKILHLQSWLQRPVAISNDVFVAEYGDQPTVGGVGMRLLRSTDDGATWTAAHTWNDIRHIHSIYDDPYVAGRLWYCIGDSGTEPRIGYTDDVGATVHDIVQSDGTQPLYKQSRAVGLMFTASAVFWAADIPEEAIDLHRYDRTSGAITTIRTGLAGSWFGAVSNGALLTQFCSVEPALSWAAPGDEYIRALTSGDSGASWETAFRWHRSQTDETTNAMAIISRPDANNRFWATLEGVESADASSSQVSLLCRLALRTYGEPHEDWKARLETQQRSRTVSWSAPGAAITANTLYDWFVAPEDIYVSNAYAMTPGGNTFSSDASNYWTIQVETYKPDGTLRRVVAAIFGPSQAVATNKPVAASALNNSIIPKGDLVAILVTKTGSIVSLGSPAVSLEIARVPQTISIPR